MLFSQGTSHDLQDDDEGDALELGPGEDDSESEGESEGPHQVGEWTLEDGPAPPIPAEMTPVLSAQLNISVKAFYERFLSDQVFPIKCMSGVLLRIGRRVASLLAHDNGLLFSVASTLGWLLFPKFIMQVI
jgi:hypothetical protein